MAKANNKTVATNQNVADFIATLSDDKKRADCQILDAMMARLAGLQPKMWGASLVGYDTYHYKYESGREGDWFRVGFAPRKANLAIYIISGFDHHRHIMARLGKYTTGVSCLYVKQLSDIDLGVLEELIIANLTYMTQTYPR